MLRFFEESKHYWKNDANNATSSGSFKFPRTSKRVRSGRKRRVHMYIAISNDDDDYDKGYVQFYKASRVLFVKKSRWNRLHPLTSRSRAQPTLLFTREHAQVCTHACTPLSFAVLYLIKIDRNCEK